MQSDRISRPSIDSPSKSPKKFREEKDKWQNLQKILDHGTQIPGETDAEKIEMIQLLSNTIGVICIIAGVLSIPTIVVSFIARNNHATGLFVAAIVLSVVLAGNIFIILGAIFGLVANSKERNQQINPAY